MSELFYEGRDGGGFWKETARWMKYEQEFDEGSNQWGHPHVSALKFSSLRVVHKALEEGLYMLDLPAVNSFTAGNDKLMCQPAWGYSDVSSYIVYIAYAC